MSSPPPPPLTEDQVNVAQVYALGLLCASEFIGMWIVVVIALSGVANHSLKKTTGSGMGYLAVAVTFGLAFAFPIICLGSISAILNPAVALALCVTGALRPGDFFALIACEFAGAFVGAWAVYFMYLPQFHRGDRESKKDFTIQEYIASLKEQRSSGSKDVDAAIITDDDDDDPYLGIFVTRPAVKSYVFNLLAEFNYTFIFVYFVLLSTTRGQYLYQPSAGLYSNIINPYLIGVMVTTMILANGATGFAGNPARDLGPRLAHWLMPVPKKQHIGSEWWYGWIPVIGPFAGGVAAGGVYLATINLMIGFVDPSTNPFQTTGTNSGATTTLNETAPPPVDIFTAPPPPL